MVNPIATALFVGRSTELTEEGHVGRVVVLAGQGKRFVDSIMQYDNKYSNKMRGWSESLKAYSESDKLLSSAGRALNLAAKYVNPLIVASAGIDVLMSDDKVNTAVISATGLGTMFAIEKLIDKKCGKEFEAEIAEKASKLFKTDSIKGKGKAAFIAEALYGAFFAVSSYCSYVAGREVGKWVMDKN